MGDASSAAQQLTTDMESLYGQIRTQTEQWGNLQEAIRRTREQITAMAE
jgi:chaperonin cofactor prefoldin